MPSLLSAGFVPVATNFQHASLSSVLLSLRQAVMSFASGISALQSLNTSGVQACRASGVPCAIDVPGAAITDIKAGSKHHRLSGFSRRRIHSSWLFAFIGRFLPSVLNVICTDTVLSVSRPCTCASALYEGCPLLRVLVAAACERCDRSWRDPMRRNLPPFATAAVAKLQHVSQRYRGSITDQLASR